MNILSFKKINKQQGLTIIELVVVISIFTVLSSVTMFNYSKFRSNISLDNLSQDLAITIRKAQVYAIGVKGTNTNPMGREFPGYGLHFSLPNIPTLPIAGDEHNFIFFSDLSNIPGGIGDMVYNQNTNDCVNLMYGNECMEIVTINGNDRIFNLCADSICSDFALSPSLDIVFTRPNSEPRFCYKINGSPCSSPSNVGIKLRSVDGREKKITIWNTGQIKVE